VGNIFLMLVFVLMFIYSNICYAVTITEENLNEAFQSFINSEENEEGYDIKVENGVITITVDGKKYSMTYDLTDNPKFIVEVPVKQGMIYEEFQKQTSSLSLPMLGYIAVAQINGVEYGDSMIYMLYQILSADSSSLLNQMKNKSITYKNNIKGLENEGTSSTTAKSEFEEDAIGYVTSTYGESDTINDENKFNTFEWSYILSDVTDESCNIVSTLTIKKDADFSKLKGFSTSVQEEFMFQDITEESADYFVKLKVGQQCVIESNDRITGYSKIGSAEIEFNQEYTTITAQGVGKANGYLYLDSGIDKTFYIIVEENDESVELEPVVLKIESTNNATEKEQENTNTSKATEETKENEIKTEGNNTENSEETKEENKILPKTGIEESSNLIILYTILVASIIGIVALILTSKKK